MRFTLAFVLGALPLLAAAAPIDVSVSDVVARDSIYRNKSPFDSDSSTGSKFGHRDMDASSPTMEDGFDASKTYADEADHSLAYTLSDDRIPTVVGYPAKSVADGTTHTVDSAVTSDDADKESPKGQAEGHGADAQGVKVEVGSEGGGLKQGL